MSLIKWLSKEMDFRIIPKRIADHLKNPESRHRQITLGFIWVGFFLLLGKLAGAAKEMAIAWRYGISETVDAYVFVFNILNWPISVWLSVLTIVLVPLFSKLRNERPVALTQFRSELLGATLLFGIIVGLFVYFGFPHLLHAGWTGLSENAQTQALEWARPFSLLVPLGFIISFFSVCMLACNRHRNTLFEAIPALVLLVALTLPYRWVTEPLLWGTIAGFALHLIALVKSLHKHGELQVPHLTYHSHAWASFWGSIGIIAAGQALMSFTSIIDQFFAAYIGPGAVSTLNYSNRVLALILGLGAIAIGRATLPVFSASHVKGDDDLRRFSMRWAKWMFIGGSAVLAIGWVVAPYFIKLLFERGAFSHQNTVTVAEVFRYGLLQVPFYFSAIVIYYYYSSCGQYKKTLFAATSCVCVKIVANYYFSQRWGVMGIQLSTAFMYLAFLYILIYSNRNRIQDE